MLRAERLIEIIRNSVPARKISDPPLWQIEKTRFQANVCRVLLLPLGGILIVLMRYFRGYSIENMAETRRQFREIWKEKELKGVPLLICANHLTFIDSALLIWAFGSNIWYLFNYRAFMWNLPAGDFFKKRFIYHAVLYLTKCIFIDRNGSSAHKNAVLNLCRYLLEKGNVVLIFPEGQRSRTGLFDVERLRFGAGKIITALGDAKVLCVYIRSPLQKGYSNYPPRGSRFQIQMKVISPEVSTETSPRRASISAVYQIGRAISEMEENFFARNPDARPPIPLSDV
ncbi:MAG TPA: lysophospholipid acyltransferase family protein [Pyrinomonadaceae bacterium]|nr:lysophospholipid acyltransferase family protein [Pyrinomonadaceae bacterium]HMP64280.1 lysophospholipid acyltransferase family protein [Pyrinomonadaceae bacterium]